MEWNNYLSLFVLIVTLFLGFFVYLKDKKNIIHKYFSFFVISTAFWIFANFMVDISKQESQVLLWSKLTLVGPILLASFFLSFSLFFPKKKTDVSLSKIFIIFIPAFILLSLTLSKFNIEKVISIPIEGPPEVKAGILYYPFAIYLLSYMGLALYRLLREYKSSSFLEKAQIKFVFLGVILSFFFAVVTNIFLLLIGISQASSIGPLFSIIFVVFTAYAIVEKQLFDFRVIATEILVTLLALGILIDALLSKSIIEGGLKASLFVIAIYGGYKLVLSVREEIRRRKEIQQLSQQLAQANEHLKELDAMKTEFVSLASHELLTPVSAIEGYLSMLLDEKLAKVEDPKAVQYLDRVYGASKRLARLVSDMLNVSRIEEGRLLVEKKDIDLTTLVKQVSEELKFKAEEGKQKIEFANPDGWSTFGDADKIKEVMVNLIGNSIKYSKDPGTITGSLG